MPTATTVLGAIQQVFDGSAAFADTGANNGIWFGQIPETFTDQSLLTGVFVCLIHNGDTPEYTEELQYLEHTLFDFEVYSVTLAQAEATAKKIKTAFDLPGTPTASSTFTIVNARVLRCWRPEGSVGYKAEYSGDRLSTGEPVFKVTLSYELVSEWSL